MVLNFNDYFLGSKDAVTAMYTELYLHGVGGFTTGVYWSSSEDAVLPNTFAQELDFSNGEWDNGLKTNLDYVRACRAFTSLTSYALRDVGPAGGYIFWKSGNNYLESAPSDQSTAYAWSNIIGVTVTGTGTAIGTGQANTTAIISQGGHINSAAKLCDDLVISVSSSVPCSVSGNAPLFAFQLTIGLSVVQMYPLNFRETSLTDSPEGEEVFYRRKFTGTLTFTNQRGDFNVLWASHQVDPCADIIITIYKGTGIYWTGHFSTTKGIFNLDRCLFTITPLPFDDYVDILDKADIQLNILSVSTVVKTLAAHGTISVGYERNRWLMDVITLLAQNIKLGATVSSEFFTNPINYVTQVTNHLTLLTIAQKSDIKRPVSTEPVRTALMSWNELMQILWGMFQVKWNYDPLTDTINVEHISWFTSTPGLDLRPQILTKATNTFSYTTEKMPKYERFKFMEANNINFIGDQIMYQSNCVNSDPNTNLKTTSVPVTTDLEYIINNVGSISDEGFVILCNYELAGNYFVELASGDYHHDDVKLNMNLSWGNLHNRYFRHNRVLIEGFLNGLVTTFWSTQKNIKQECYAQICSADNYDPADEITTELGETYFAGEKASVEQSDLKPSGETKFSLLYGTPGNTPTPITDGKFIDIYEDGCGMFTANLSEAADANLDILIRYVIFDSTGAQVCNNGAGCTWTIPITSLTDTFTIPSSACDMGDIPVGGCIWYLPHSFEVIGRPDWFVALKKDPNCDCPGMYTTTSS